MSSEPSSGRVPRLNALEIAREHRSVLKAGASLGDDGRARRCARSLLLSSRGTGSRFIAKEVGVSSRTVLNWRARYRAEELNGLGGVRAGRGAKRTITAAQEDEILRAALNDPPPSGVRWSLRGMASAQGVSARTVSRIWQDDARLQGALTRRTHARN